MTTLAIIGLGGMGKALAKRFAGKTDLIIASRDTAAATAFAATLPAGVTVLDVDAAMTRADIVLLAVPFAAALDAAANPALAGKIVIDISNPLKPDFSGLSLGTTTSAGEEVQAAAPGARVVKAYNTILSGQIALPASQTATVPVYIAGNDANAVAIVEDLVKLSGFAVQRTGNLDAARLLEPLALLNVRFAFTLGHGPNRVPRWTDIAA